MKLLKFIEFINESDKNQKNVEFMEDIFNKLITNIDRYEIESNITLFCEYELMEKHPQTGEGHLFIFRRNIVDRKTYSGIKQISNKIHHKTPEMTEINNLKKFKIIIKITTKEIDMASDLLDESIDFLIKDGFTEKNESSNFFNRSIQAMGFQMIELSKFIIL